jgi:diguanylate cyclase (GGDEF)-like protein
MRLSISRTLLAIYLVIAILSVGAIGIATHWVKERSVATLALSESRRNATLIFQNLYSVMRKGWSKAEISELVDRMNSTVPDIHVEVYRSRAVADLFGEIDSDRQMRETDPVIAEVLASGQEKLVNLGSTIRYVYPVVVSEECLSCHSNVSLGAVNGVIDIQFPTENLKVPLNFTLNTMIYVFSVSVTILLVLVLLKIRFLVAQPISSLTRHIEEIIVSGDLSRRISERASQWLIEVRSLTDNFNRLMGELQGSRDALVQQSTTDALTGLANRRRFDEEFPREIERARRHGLPLAVIMIDLDGFKPVNDTHGHGVGDQLLATVAVALESQARANDLVVRLGGDEFAVLAPDTSPEGVSLFASRLEAAVKRVRIEVPDGEVSVGASMGIALYPQNGMTPEALLSQADEAMYADKKRRKAGR